jgi:hypothetical protein
MSVEHRNNLLKYIDPLKTFIETYFTFGSKHYEPTDFIGSTTFLFYFRAYCHRLGLNIDEKIAQKRATLRMIQSVCPQASRFRTTNPDGTQTWRIMPLVPTMELGLEFSEEVQYIS